MGNCLKTQLKASVADESLEKLGTIKLSFKKAISASQINKFEAVQDYEVGFKLVDGSTITSANDKCIKVDSINGIIRKGAIVSNGFNVACSGGQNHFTCELSNKYYISRLYRGYNFDLDKFDYLSSLTGIESLEGLRGNLKSLSKIPTLCSLNVWSENNSANPNVCTGKLSDGIGFNTNIDHIKLISLYNKDSESLERLVAMQRGAGKTESGEAPITINFNTANISFNNTLIPLNDQILSWTATTITLGSTTINNSDLIAPSTSTAQQIADWKTAGYTVYDIYGNLL